MDDSLTERWLILELWSQELGIPIATLEKRLQFVPAFPGRAPDGSPLLSYCEVDVRRACADLIN